MYSLIIVLVLALICVNSVASDEYEGDPCEKDGKSGTCKLISDCPSAIEDIQSGIYPQVCGFKGTKSIVCCLETAGEKSLAKCKEYAQFAYRIEDSPTLSISSKPKYIKFLDCSIDYEKLIVGGKKAKKMEFPHMAQVGYLINGNIQYACGGSIISETFVLTAGHCISDRSAGEPKKVRVGISNVDDLRIAQVRDVVEIFKHPKYDFNKYNDIALLRVNAPFNFTPAVRPACLFTQKTFPFENSIACGWGKKGFTAEESKDLMKVTLRFFTNEECNNAYANSGLSDGIVDDLMVCAGNNHKDTCQGDSGGPLQIYHETTKEIKCMYDIVGVTSFGKACGLARNTPGVYTRVSNYIGWIESVVWKD